MLRKFGINFLYELELVILELKEGCCHVFFPGDDSEWEAYPHPFSKQLAAAPVQVMLKES
jgi:hypothetical protein